MKKHTFIIGTLVCIMGLMTACNNDQTTAEDMDTTLPTTTKQEIVYNDHIQTHFFGFSFGDSPQVVKKKLDSAGLYTHDKIAPNGRMAFRAGYPQDNFAFGGFSWDYCHPSFSNNRLFEIEFLKPFKTKEAAASYYNSLLNSLSEKYHMQIYYSTDSRDAYETYLGRTYNNQVVAVSYSRYESVGHEIWYGTFLTYADYNFYQENDEL